MWGYYKIPFQNQELTKIYSPILIKLEVTSFVKVKMIKGDEFFLMLSLFTPNGKQFL